METHWWEHEFTQQALDDQQRQAAAVLGIEPPGVEHPGDGTKRADPRRAERSDR